MLKEEEFEVQYETDLLGIKCVTKLPDPSLSRLWDSIIVDVSIKDRLLSQAVLNFRVRHAVDQSMFPLHGIILLVGVPGTGKTSLARGLADRTAQSISGTKSRLVEVEAHELTSSAMGKTQKVVSNLFKETLSDLANSGPLIVLLDEVETLAADRAKLSLEANPIDIHRATDAVLTQLDMLANEYKNILFLATSNYPEAVDSAFISRCDLVIKIPLPSRNACKEILKSSLGVLSKGYPKIGTLVNDAKFDDCAEEFVGLDGRTIKKTVINALASNKETALNPDRLELYDLAEAARRSKFNKGQDSSVLKSVISKHYKDRFIEDAITEYLKKNRLHKGSVNRDRRKQ